MRSQALTALLNEGLGGDRRRGPSTFPKTDRFGGHSTGPKGSPGVVGEDLVSFLESG